MSKFKFYAEELDRIVKESFQIYREAEERLHRAEERCREIPVQTEGWIRDPERQAEAVRRDADYKEAKAALKAVKRNFSVYDRKIRSLREELKEDLDSVFAIDPSKLDNNTLELLRSGIVTPYEFTKLMDQAEAAGNYTMVRLIGQYANMAIEEATKKYGENSGQVKILSGVRNHVASLGGEAYLRAFDDMAEIYTRFTNNPKMADHWDALTRGIIEGF